MKVYTEENDYSIKYKEDEFDIHTKPKKVFIKSNFPCGFVKNDFDQEMTLKLSKPEMMNLECNNRFPDKTFDNKEIKEMRIDEKRNFELENCKLKSFSKSFNKNNLKNDEDQVKEQIDNFFLFDSQKTRNYYKF